MVGPSDDGSSSSSRNPFPYQAMTVRGLKRTNADRQPLPNRESHTQGINPRKLNASDGHGGSARGPRADVRGQESQLRALLEFERFPEPKKTAKENDRRHDVPKLGRRGCKFNWFNENRVGRDRFRQRVRGMAIREVLTALRSPGLSPQREHRIGSVRRKCLDLLLVLNQEPLRQTPPLYFAYYLWARPHLSLAKDAPLARAVPPPERGPVVDMAGVGGLHHRYERRPA